MQFSRVSHNGITFSCQQCGRCCSAGTEGYIFLYWQDLKILCDYFQISCEDLAEKYLDITDYEFEIWNEDLSKSIGKKIMDILILRASKNNDCIFLTEMNGIKGCEIYPARPFQCRSFPFWTVIMNDINELEQTAGWCEGLSIGLTGNISDEFDNYYSPKEVDQFVKKERRIERDYYLEMKRNRFNIFNIYPFLKKIKRFRDYKLNN